MTLTEHLRANPELVSLDRSTTYLASRVRTRTPLGAAEYLRMAGDDAERCQVALECMKIYRSFFPEELANSTSPYLSTQREHELYRLIDNQLFPLMLDRDVDLGIDEFMQSEPRAYLRVIPMRGLQRHLWLEGQFDFREIQPAFRLALTMARVVPSATWESLFTNLPAPAPPLAAVGWSLFNYSCQVEENPLVHLPLAFHFVTYKTGNPWLDIPQMAMLGFEWSTQKVAELARDMMLAEQMGEAMTELSEWLEEDPESHYGRAVELWNDASAKEQQSGGGDLVHDDMTGDFVRRENWF